MRATSNPATIAAQSPTRGLWVKIVTTDAVNAPASIIPSSAILITPPRSEYMPPSAASVRGVEYLTIEASNDKLIIFLSITGQVTGYRLQVTGSIASCAHP